MQTDSNTSQVTLLTSFDYNSSGGKMYNNIKALCIQYLLIWKNPKQVKDKKHDTDWRKAKSTHKEIRSQAMPYQSTRTMQRKQEKKRRHE